MAFPRPASVWITLDVAVVHCKRSYLRGTPLGFVGLVSEHDRNRRTISALMPQKPNTFSTQLGMIGGPKNIYNTAHSHSRADRAPIDYTCTQRPHIG